MAVIVTTNGSTDHHERGRTAELVVVQGIMTLDVLDVEGKRVALYREWLSVAIDDDGDEADEGEDGNGTVWIDVLPDMTKFREAFNKAVEDLSIAVTVDATIDLDDTDPMIKRNREAIRHELRHPLGDRFKCEHPLCYLPTAGCPCGETH